MKEKEEVLALAKQCFEYNPKVEKLWSTGDGNFFEREDQANNHAKTFTDGGELPRVELLFKSDLDMKNTSKSENKK